MSIALVCEILCLMHEGVVVQPCIMSKAIMLEIKSIYANKQKHPCQITIAPVLKSKALVPKMFMLYCVAGEVVPAVAWARARSAAAE